MSSLRYDWLFKWAPRMVGLCFLTSWVIPSNTYEVSETEEKASFALGWPGKWYHSTVHVKAGLVMQAPDYELRQRNWEARGADNLWLIPAGALDQMPNPPRGVIGWNPTMCFRQRRAVWSEAPWFQTVIAVGFFYVGWRVREARFRRLMGEGRGDDTPPTSI